MNLIGNITVEMSYFYIACFATLVGGYYYRVYLSANSKEIALVGGKVSH